MNFNEYNKRIDDILQRIESIFPSDEEWEKYSANMRTEYLIKQGEIEISFDLMEHKLSEEYNIQIIPVNRRPNTGDIRIVRWRDDNDVILYQRPGIVFEDVPYRFIDEMLKRILQKVKEKELFHFHMDSAYKRDGIPIDELIYIGFSEKEGWNLDA
jgi:hypothetical protein|nr:MAG TPA: hypothetical protein [Caudoviricetes sp.]